MVNKIDFNGFPEEVISYIFSFLDPITLAKNKEVCKTWNHISVENFLWKPHYDNLTKLFQFVAQDNKIQYWNRSFVQEQRFRISLLYQIKAGDFSIFDKCPILKKDQGFIFSAVKKNGLALKHASETLQNDPNIALAAVKQNSLAREFVGEMQRHAVLTAIQHNCKEPNFASETFTKEIFNQLCQHELSSSILRSLALLPKILQKEALISIAKFRTPSELKAINLPQLFERSSFNELTELFVNLENEISQENLTALMALFPNYINHIPEDLEGKTALHNACELKKPKIVEALLSLGADPEIRDQSGNSVIDYLFMPHCFSFKMINVFIKHQYHDQLLSMIPSRFDHFFIQSEIYLSQNREKRAEQSLKILFENSPIFDGNLQQLSLPTNFPVESFPHFEKLLKENLSKISLNKFYQAIASDFQQYIEQHSIEYDFDLLLTGIKLLPLLYDNDRVTALFNTLKISETGFSIDEIAKRLPKSQKLYTALAIEKAMQMHFSFIENIQWIGDLLVSENLSLEDIKKDISVSKKSGWFNFLLSNNGNSSKSVEFLKTKQGRTALNNYLERKNPSERFNGVVQALSIIEKIDEPKQRASFLNSIAVSVLEREHKKGIRLGGECESLLQIALKDISPPLRREFLRYVYLWSDRFLKEKPILNAFCLDFTENGETALTFAAKNGFVHLTEWLLQQGAHPRQANSQGEKIEDILLEKTIDNEQAEKKPHWEALYDWHLFFISQKIPLDEEIARNLREETLKARVDTLIKELGSVTEMDELHRIQAKFFKNWNFLKFHFWQQVSPDVAKFLTNQALIELENAHQNCLKTHH